MDMTVLVGSCDKYFFLLEDFAYRFNQYVDLDVKKYIMGETLEFNNGGFSTILCGKIPYSQCLKQAFSVIDTKYIFWLQDDYFIISEKKKEQFERYLNIMEDNAIDRLGIYPHYKACSYCEEDRVESLKRLSPKSPFSISMQASIWRKDFFESCLQTNPESPWEFERNGSARLNQRSHKSYIDTVAGWYHEACHRGKPTRQYYELKRK